MTRMKDLANLLGLELYEEFKINDVKETENNIFRFTNDGIEYLNKSNGVWLAYDLSSIPIAVCNGDYKIIKLPWKPKDEEQFWYVSSEGYIIQKTFNGDTFSILCYKFGNCFKTKEEAKKHVDEILEKYNSK